MYQTRAIFRSLAVSFIFSLVSVLPWWFLAKFLRIRLNSPHAAIIAFVVFLLLWVAFAFGSILRQKPQSEREQISSNIVLGYGRLLLLIISVQFVLALSLLIISSIKR